MGKGGPKPAHHIKLEEILFGVGASPEDGIEVGYKYDPRKFSRQSRSVLIRSYHVFSFLGIQSYKNDNPILLSLTIFQIYNVVKMKPLML